MSALTIIRNTKKVRKPAKSKDTETADRIRDYWNQMGYVDAAIGQE